MNTQNVMSNEYVIYTICTITVCIISGYLIKSYFYSNPTTNGTQTPPTFNLTVDQVKELNENFRKRRRIKFRSKR